MTDVFAVGCDEGIFIDVSLMVGMDMHHQGLVRSNYKLRIILRSVLLRSTTCQDLLTTSLTLLYAADALATYSSTPRIPNAAAHLTTNTTISPLIPYRDTCLASHSHW